MTMRHLPAHVLVLALIFTPTMLTAQDDATPDDSTSAATDDKNAGQAAANAQADTADTGEPTDGDSTPAPPSVSGQHLEKPTPQQSLFRKSAPQSSAHAAMLAALRAQLQTLIAQAGVPDKAKRATANKQLDAVAMQSAELAKQLKDDRQRLEARYVELAARNVLLKDAQSRGDKREQSYQAGQLRTAAWSAKRLKLAPAGALGDFWLLQADLHDLNMSTEKLNERQRGAIELMERFLRAQGASVQRESEEQLPRARSNVVRGGANNGVAEQRDREDAAAKQTIVRDVRVALLRLYDQQGRSVDAARLLAQLQPQPARRYGDKSDALFGQYSYTNLIGQQFDANLRLGRDAAGTPIVWSSRDRLGKVVLIHFWSPSFEPTTRAFRALKSAVDRHKASGFEVHSVRVADPVARQRTLAKATSQPDDADAVTRTATAATKPAGTPAALAWPNYNEGPGQVSLQRMFAVRSLPRYVLIDRRGRVAAVAGSLAILDQVPGLLTPVAPSTAPAADVPANAAEPQVQQQRSPDR